MVVLDVSVHRWESFDRLTILSTTERLSVHPDKSGCTVTIRFYVCTMFIIFLSGL
jgi:hypothetical protein